ncbi:MAG: TlyA family RNA methyltransferase [Myxococcota bacterium]|nr:TlyA family RNA methyltransferase [Myxococcota bacterium]
MKSRLDERVVAEGIAESRARARALILAGRILVDDVPVDKAGARVRPGARLRLRGELARFVSRGGEKLEGALEAFEIDVAGLRCLDIGASTGGFSDCLLQRGAAGIVAVDVGRGQLHEKLRQDSRVHSLERKNVRSLGPGDVPGPVDLVVIDVAFISLRQVLPSVAQVAGDAPVVALVKPQFEVGRAHVGKGGVVSDDGLRAGACDDVQACAEGLGYRQLGRSESRLAGPKGNREIFLWLERTRSGADEASESDAAG